MKDYSQLNLQNNPFADITPLLDQEDSANLIWAGLPSLKQQLEDIHRQALTVTPRQIVLNWGTVGAGKTYAAFYFSDQTRLKSLAPDYEVDIIHIYVRTPKEGNNATSQLFKDILDSLSLSRVKLQIQSIIKVVGRDELLKFLAQRIRSEEFAKAILLLGDENIELSEMMSRYLYGSATNTDLKKMGLARPLKSTADFGKILAGVLLCFVGIRDNLTGQLFLWLDEMEDLLFFTAKQYRPFSQFLRDVFDQLNEGCTVFMNFTLAEPDQDTIKLLLGNALWSRINKKVRFNELSVPEAMLYCKDLLKSAQVDQELNDYSPFTENTLSYLLEMIPQAYMIPREINKYCYSVLDFALESNETSITQEIITKWDAQRDDFE